MRRSPYWKIISPHSIPSAKKTRQLADSATQPAIRVPLHAIREPERGWIKLLQKKNMTLAGIAARASLDTSSVRRRIRRMLTLMVTGKLPPYNPPQPGKQRKPKAQHKKTGRRHSPIGIAIVRAIQKLGNNGEIFEVEKIYAAVDASFPGVAVTVHGRRKLHTATKRIIDRLRAEGKIARDKSGHIQIVPADK